MKTEEKKQVEEKLPAEVRANMLSSEKSIFFNVALFEQAQRIATMFANSTLVPAHFRENVGNCMIGLNYAARLQADPFMVLQCLYVVHGRPGIEGKLVEAAVNQSAKYSEPLQYEWLDPKDEPVARYEVLNHKDFGEYGCQAFSIDAKSGKRVDGPKITWKLVKAEGWNEDKKNRTTGATIKSKWNTMPEMMFYYRAASWFANKNCPEVKLGMHTVEELDDVVDLNKGQNGAYGVTDSAAALNEKIKSTTDKPTGEDPYKVKDETETEKPEPKKESTLSEQEQEVYNGFIHIRKQETLRGTEQILLKEMPSWSKELRKEWSDKWLRIMREAYDFEFENKQAEPDDEPRLMENDRLDDEPETQEERPDPSIMLNCPKTATRVRAVDCDINKCEDREICTPYITYQKNIDGG